MLGRTNATPTHQDLPMPRSGGLSTTGLRLGGRVFGPGAPAIMAIVNRTPDSFFDRGATFTADAALRAVEIAVGAGADIIDT
jgi:dihydropteroate synthase